jgi:DNA polymerase IIIc chi subunit
VVIIQDAAEMIIAGRTHYPFLHEVFSCQLFKEFVKVMMIALVTVVEEEKSSEIFERHWTTRSTNFITHLMMYSKRHHT